MVKVLFVCMGNICRSPTAHGVFEHMLKEQGMVADIEVDSCGTHAYHIGKGPDPRSQQVAEQRGFSLQHLRARRVEMSDFEYFDYILAMDRENLSILESMTPSQHAGKLQLFLDFAPSRSESEVPDPYYGGPKGFDIVLDMIEEASQGLLDDIQQRHIKD
jgi:protein-tyrosine phosphatase